MSDVYLIKTDSDGDYSPGHGWTKTFGGGYTYNNRGSIGSSVRQTADGGYIIVGSTVAFGDGHGRIFLIKTDANGYCCDVNEGGGNPAHDSVPDPAQNPALNPDRYAVPTTVHDPTLPVYDPNTPS